MEAGGWRLTGGSWFSPSVMCLYPVSHLVGHTEALTGLKSAKYPRQVGHQAPGMLLCSGPQHREYTCAPVPLGARRALGTKLRSFVHLVKSNGTPTESLELAANR